MVSSHRFFSVVPPSDLLRKSHSRKRLGVPQRRIEIEHGVLKYLDMNTSGQLGRSAIAES